ncbi:hypothetical protein [Pseudomonas amygdali]|uniref:hypothetical protein n=1 Tax=Pseudomonas amygdali TaxID=47877 RepID=UPI001FB5D78D|nr:hypothetical protein [Pseudomonas amygdali]UPT36280.1 hypothetical protein LT107_23370 [Pseudomonas amygdali pv. loropetali]
MLLAVLTVLNALCLIGGLLFNAELLNKAGTDIPLKNLQALEIYGQSLAAVSVCLAAWRPGACVSGLMGNGDISSISCAPSCSVPWYWPR